MFLKDHLQQELIEMLKDYRGTVIMVSHNRDEIYRFSEELLIMDRGMAVTYGKTREIFEDPKYCAAARLTGCKNFSGVRRIDDHTLEALDWGIILELGRRIPKSVTCVGFRAHEFVPVWGERQKNCIRAELSGSAELPFEKNFYLKPESGACGETICWFLQKDRWDILEEKGMPDFLQFPEKQLLLLTDDTEACG